MTETEKVRMARRRSTNRNLRNGQLALWAVEVVHPHPPQQQGNLARGSGTMLVQPDGTICIDGSDIPLTDRWGRPCYLLLKLRVYEGLDEVVEKIRI